MIRIKIHTILGLKKIIGQGELEVSMPQRSTVESVLSWMTKTWGERLSSYLFDSESGSIFPHIRLMVNGRDLRFLNGMETVLQDGDELLILPPVAGG